MDDSGQNPEVNGGQVQEDPANPPAPQQETPTYSPFAQNYLNTVPEAERDVVGRHIQEWDRGFTRYAQGVQGQLQQYRSYGSPEDLQTKVAIYQRLMDDPQSVANWLAEQGYSPKQAQQAVQQAQGAVEEDPILKHPKFQEMMQRSERMDRVLGMIAEQQQTRAKQEEEARADKELSDYLTAFPNKQIPEPFILAYLNANIVDPNQIVAEWNKVTQGITNGRSANQVPNIIGATTQPTQRQDPATMTDDQRVAALVAMLPKDT